MNAELNLNNHQSLQAFVGSHFMFNVLNQVQNRFISGEIESGVQVMSLYNKMLRYALKCSESGTTLLSEEWQFLKNYMAAELMRFEGNFTIMMRPQIINDLSYLPAFLLQPIVEAALHASLVGGNHSGVNIVYEELNERRQFQINNNSSETDIPEKYLKNITRVKERIKIWNEGKETSIALKVENKGWILSLN